MIEPDGGGRNANKHIHVHTFSTSINNVKSTRFWRAGGIVLGNYGLFLSNQLLREYLALWHLAINYGDRKNCQFRSGKHKMW
jgi:hypothetical protein